MIPNELMELYNRFGCTSLRLARRKGTYWGQWRDLNSLMHFDKVKWENYQDRTIGDIEIVADYDTFPCMFCQSLIPLKPIECPHCGCVHTREQKEQGILTHVALRRHIFRSWKFKYQLYHTGGNGYHFHFLFPELRKFDQHKRWSTKQRFLEIIHAELQKASENVPILRPGCMNRKTNKPKTLVEETGVYNWRLQEFIYYFNNQDCVVV